jgi:hypothetical protein
LEPVRTLPRSTKFSLKTSKSPNTKVVHFLKTNNFSVEWHLEFEVHLGENAFERALFLFTGAEKNAKLACRFCPIL